MKRWGAVVTAMLLLSGAVQAAEDQAAGDASPQSTVNPLTARAERPASETATANLVSIPQASAIDAVQAGTLLQTAAFSDLPAPGYCPVIADLLVDICATNPEDSSCTTP